MKYIFLSLLFFSCAHRPSVQYNDPEATRMENEHRSLLVGKWLGKKSLLVLSPAGDYQEKDLNGKVKSGGIWGVSGEIFFILSNQNRSLYRNHQIIELNSSNFSIKELKTKEILLFRRLQE